MQPIDNNHIESAVVRALAYFDIFHYPLTLEEIVVFTNAPSISLAEVRAHLSSLEIQKRVFRFENFYSLRPDERLASERIKCNASATQWLPTARRQAKVIYNFPFVRSVMASGSLSKNCMKEDSDLDFFVITAKNRLWITRFLLTVYKKIFLRNSHKLFCINYYLEEHHLDLPDKNLFTATELITLIPLQGNHYYDELMSVNLGWAKKFFPNFQVAEHVKEKPSIGKKILESLLSLIPAHASEKTLRNITHRRWQRLYEKQMGHTEFNRAFHSTAFEAKAHPRNFQKQVLDRYEAQLKQYDSRLELQTR